MAEPGKRSTFIEAWLDDIREDVGRYGVRSIFPWTPLVCVAVGWAVALYVPKANFWGHPEISLVFFTAIITLNSLLLALSWNSFGKIYEIASEPHIAQYLRKNNLLQGYIFQVDYIHYTQVAALALSGAALALCVVEEIPHQITDVVELFTLQRISMASSIAASIYALKSALGAVRIMQDLIWYSPHIQNSSTDLTVHKGGARSD